MRKILLGVNFEHEADAAIEDACILAKNYGASILPIHAVESLSTRNQQAEIDLLTSQITEKINKVADFLAIKDIEVYKPVIEKGNPTTVLQSATKALDTDLLVIGAGVSHVDHYTLGKTAKEIIRHSASPVWVSNSAVKKIDYGQITCAIDLSQHSLLTLKAAIALAKQFYSRLHILHVKPEEYCYPGMYNVDLPVSLLDQKKSESNTQLDSQCALATKGLDPALKNFLKDVCLQGVETEVHVKVGAASREIVSFVNSCNSGLLVLGSLGQGNIITKLLGGTVEKVLQQLPCSIVTIPHIKSE